MILLLALLAAKGTPSQGHALLQNGRYRQAIVAFRRELESNPGHPPLELGLARAQAGSGRCSQAMVYFERHRRAEAWRAYVAEEQAACAEILGEDRLAVALLEEGLLLSPEDKLPDLRFALGLLALKLQDPAVLDQAEALGFGEDPMSQAFLAFARGDHDGVFEGLAEQRARTPNALNADILEARAWLELDDPGQAIRVLDPERGNRYMRPGIAPWLAEARRRQGQVDLAAELLDLKVYGPEPGPDIEAMQLRARADLGEPVQVEAEALLERYPFHPEVLATAWYVDRDPELARRFEALRASPLERLELLLPWEERPE